MRDRRVARVIASMMLVLGGLYTALVYGQTHQAAYTSEGIALGASKGDVTYHLGPTDSQSSQTWVYRQGGRTLTLKFDAQNGLLSTECQSPPEARVPCAAVLNIGMGSDEEDMLKRFGRPVREILHSGEKTCLYPGLGLALILRRSKVEEITHTAPASSSAFWRNVLWEILP